MYSLVTSPKYFTFYLDYGTFELVNDAKQLERTLYKNHSVEWMAKLVPEKFKLGSVFSLSSYDLNEVRSNGGDLISSLGMSSN